MISQLISSKGSWPRFMLTAIHVLPELILLVVWPPLIGASIFEKSHFKHNGDLFNVLISRCF